MNGSAKGFVIFYSDKYYRLLWSLETLGEYGFDRSDAALGTLSKQPADLYFGYYRNFEELELEVFLYQNKGVKGHNLLNAKPNPHFVLAGKGEDPSDFFQSLAHTIRSLPSVQAVVPLNLNGIPKIKELLYSQKLC